RFLQPNGNRLQFSRSSNHQLAIVRDSASCQGQTIYISANTSVARFFVDIGRSRWGGSNFTVHDRRPFAERAGVEQLEPFWTNRLSSCSKGPVTIGRSTDRSCRATDRRFPWEKFLGSA